MEKSTRPARTRKRKQDCTSSHLPLDAVLSWVCDGDVGVVASRGMLSDPCRPGRWIRPGDADTAVLLPDEEGDASIKLPRIGPGGYGPMESTDALILQALEAILV
jgi:hypothetical protein